MFTDESSFIVRTINNMMLARRKTRLRLHLKHIVPTSMSGYRTEPVWVGLCVFEHKTIVWRRSFYRNSYRVIIDNCVLHFMYHVCNGPKSFVLQKDNCGPFGVKRISDRLSTEEVRCTKWSPRSTDLNSTENIWTLMKCHLRKYAVHPKNSLDLFRVLSEGLNSLPNSKFKNLVASMQRRIEIVRKKK